MNKISRALRRHHRERLFLRAIKKYHQWGYELEVDQEWVEWQAQRCWNNMKRCSCQMCRNPRRCGWNKKERFTMQELKAEQDFKDQMSQLDL